PTILYSISFVTLSLIKDNAFIIKSCPLYSISIAPIVPNTILELLLLILMSLFSSVRSEPFVIFTLEQLVYNPNVGYLFCRNSLVTYITYGASLIIFLDLKYLGKESNFPAKLPWFHKASLVQPTTSIR